MNVIKKQSSKTKSKEKSRFSKINAWFHLWLGLASGIVVFIMGITGCILVFQQEIRELTSPWLNVEAQTSHKVLPPSKIYAAVKKALPEKAIHGVWYNGLDKTIKVDIESDSLIYVNPYNGKITGMVDHEDFFHEIDEGHRYLWLGKEIGTTITSWATLIFFFLLVSGIILWFPKKWNKTTINSSFKIKWNARFKRLNYDLHNVLGFYSLILAFLIALTGLIMSFHWVRESTYWITGGFTNEKEKKEVVAVKKDTLSKPKYDMLTSADIIFDKVRKEIAKHNNEAVIIHFPDEPKDNFYACTDMHNGNWRDLYFDQKTLELLPSSKKYIGDEKFHDWMSRSNYSLHVGAIGGITTKIIYFTASLICASLPLTGFYIWWGRKKKTKKS
ncbi:PepSY-associated TM helix domain-containing protein [Flavobacterium quisquiliarum]|uniref:PepSY-associated TM helix domain-containing protein n=1 Tax=Flavobacterium quisquiliarum TaxID=1834436 RepID=A0ABV8W4N9_9FLAO|nr:PepSY-associated TM helix domain-containing protein [Flavobacterium quisquiliarum]MBW1654392.1 PepSY domain-containing protein [Flavobacterium quisquiliarum]NWL01176.1 PepSY domain-containing protein [Flavobacterium collinsii]